MSVDTLMQEIKKGSNEAFNKLVEQNRGWLYRFVFSKTGNPHSAEDLSIEL